MPELPFSNAWIAQHTINKLPEDSVLHLGILNSLRTWNFFECTVNNAAVYCNTGGFGIDGCLSSLIGASLASPNKLCFGVIGDLAFYYDINALDCGQIGRNLRVIVINNGCGAEFKLYNHFAMKFGDDGDSFMAARGHFAREGRILLKHYAENLGFEYLSASNKEEYLACLDRFTTPEMLDKPIFFEVFTEPKDESDALFGINTINIDKLFPASTRIKRTAKKIVKAVMGPKNIARVKRLLGR